MSKKNKKQRDFDHNSYCKRHVAFHVCYLGWAYHGFAVQETTGKTVESELFRALTLCKLIQSRETSNYHRCGRTDKGVSAFQQVITIDVRSNLTEGKGVFDFEGCTASERKLNSDKEIDYCKLLNANLPPDIQVIAWSPCENREFSARFDCVSRTYKYFFPRGDLCLDKLRSASQRLLGENDFRNFCKMDVAHGVVNYNRSISAVEAKALDETNNPFDMCELTITGKAFLWHQIRCVVAVLFRVASGKENEQVISDLLNVEENPRRPQYAIASEIPLNLFESQHQPDLEWIYEPEAVETTMHQLMELWTEHSVKTTMLMTVLDRIAASTKFDLSSSTKQTDFLYGLGKAKQYTPLMEMLKCPSLDEKLSAPSAKRRKK